MKSKDKHVRALFISDLHLRTSWCKSDRLLAFLQSYTADVLYLVGDILDFWNTNVFDLYGNSNQRQIIETILDKERFDNVIYIAGNHDDINLHKNEIQKIFPLDVIKETKYTTKLNKNYLITHGHEFDRFNSDNTGFYRRTYSNIIHRPRTWTTSLLSNLIYFTLKFHLKRFKNKARLRAYVEGYNGIIVGHTHFPTIDTLDITEYLNIGDWVDNSTGIIEKENGILKLVYG